MCFLVLSNCYKGDNITRLTLPPPLVKFDTFNSLVENGFKIFVRQIYLRYSELAFLKHTFGYKYFATRSRHEYFPVFSELWREMMSRFRSKYSLSKLKNEFSEQEWVYLNNTVMFPAWNKTNGEIGTRESLEYILDNYMDACNKSAVLLTETMGIPLYHILKGKEKAVYYVKDVINENIMAYRYWGFFHTSVMLKPRYFLQSGVSEWWQKFFKWSLMVKANLEKHTQSSRLTKQSVTAILNLFIIPLVGLLLSILVFLLIEGTIFRIGKFIYRKLAMLFFTHSSCDNVVHINVIQVRSDTQIFTRKRILPKYISRISRIFKKPKILE